MKKFIAGALLFICIAALVVGIGKVPTKATHQANGDGKIGIIYLEGPIVGGSGSGGIWGDPTGTDTTIRYIRKAGEDKDVRAIVLRLNTPGGSAAASQEVAEEIDRVRKAGKIVVTSMGDVAASGGYWIAAGTDRIVANPATTTGSIGVIWTVANWQELYRKVGIQQETIKSGPYKDIGSPARPLSGEEKELLQGMVNDIYEQFVTVVANGRKMDEKKVRTLADGRIYTGRQAKELGLVDDLGNLYDAIDIAAQMAGITDKPEIKEFGKIGTWEKLLGGPDEAIQLWGQRWTIPLPVFVPGLLGNTPQ
jgi:protease IV